MITFALIPIALIIEGLGLPYSHFIAPILIIFTPFILFLVFRRKKITIPKKLKVLFASFVALSLISSLFSQNILNSIFFTLFYAACFLIFIYVTNFKKQLIPYVLPLIFSISIIFCLYSLLTINYSLLTPSNGYQLVFSYFGSHNHLGDFLLLPLTACIYLLLNKNSHLKKLLTINYLLFAILLLPFFLFSYSRSGYLSLILTTIIMVVYFLRTKALKFNILSASLLLITLLFSFIFLFAAHKCGCNFYFDQANKYLASNQNLNYKTPFGGRGEYVREAVLSITTRPIFGVGPGNFVEASKKFNTIPVLWVETSHNIFLDIFAENGILAGIIFVLIVYELIRRSEKNIHFFMALALLLNFQTDYTFRIFSMLMLFFVLIGICYREDLK